MPVEKHTLAQELPEFKDRIHELKTHSAHFAHMFHKYDSLDHDIHDIETGAAPASDERLEQMKKERLRLKDELFAMLKVAS